MEGGPTYRLTLTGEASRVEYKFSKTIVEVGTQVHTVFEYILYLSVCLCVVIVCTCIMNHSSGSGITGETHKTISPKKQPQF